MIDYEELTKDQLDQIWMIALSSGSYFETGTHDGHNIAIFDSMSDVNEICRKVNKYLADQGFEEQAEDQYDLASLFFRVDRHEAYSDDYAGMKEYWRYCEQCKNYLTTEPSSAHDIPDFHSFDEGESIICGDCIRADPGLYIQQLTESEFAANTILMTDQLKELGFVKQSEDLHTRWPYGTEMVEKFLHNIRLSESDRDVILHVESLSTFASRYTAWSRPKPLPPLDPYKLHGLTRLDDFQGLELGIDYEWVCLCATCGRKAEWYLTEGKVVAERWRWHCADISCPNDTHTPYEDSQEFMTIAVLCREAHKLDNPVVARRRA